MPVEENSVKPAEENSVKPAEENSVKPAEENSVKNAEETSENSKKNHHPKSALQVEFVLAFAASQPNRVDQQQVASRELL